VKEKKLRDKFSIQEDLSLQNSAYAELSQDTHRKIQRYVKGAVGLGTGFLMSFLCPLGFVFVMAVGISMNIRSSNFAKKHQLLLVKPVVTLGRTTRELRIMALSDERLAGVIQFYYARTIFMLCSFLPVFVFVTLAFVLIIAYS